MLLANLGPPWLSEGKRLPVRRGQVTVSTVFHPEIRQHDVRVDAALRFLQNVFTSADASGDAGVYETMSAAGE